VQLLVAENITTSPIAVLFLLLVLLFESRKHISRGSFSQKRDCAGPVCGGEGRKEGRPDRDSSIKFLMRCFGGQGNRLLNNTGTKKAAFSYQTLELDLIVTHIISRGSWWVVVGWMGVPAGYPGKIGTSQNTAIQLSDKCRSATALPLLKHSGQMHMEMNQECV
jgi:hypothetical protein